MYQMSDNQDLLVNALKDIQFKCFNERISEMWEHNVRYHIMHFKKVKADAATEGCLSFIVRDEKYYVRRILAEIERLKRVHRVRWYNVPHTRKQLDIYRAALCYLETILQMHYKEITSV